MPVNTNHPDYDAYAPIWKRARDVAKGSDAVKASGVTYLPRLEEQTDSAYNAYKTRATFYNATYRVIAAMLGMLFRKEPTKEVPASLDDNLEDINLKGDDLLTFANKSVYELVTVSRIGLLNDHTKKPVTGDLTIAQAQQIGFRATLQMYPAESIINWRKTTVANKTVLGMVVLKEEIEKVDPTDKFKTKCQEQYRVLELDENGYYSVSVSEVDASGKEVVIEPPFYPTIDGKPLNEIPFQILGPGGLQIDIEEPAMIDLIDLNLAHYRTSADYEHGSHFTGLPQPYITGYSPQMQEDGKATPEKFYIGSGAAWLFRDPQAKAEYMEFKGEGLKALESNLDRKEGQMAILGARMLAPEKKVAETATTAAIHRTGENAILSSVSVTVSKALTTALTLFATWSGTKAECKFELNRDFLPLSLDAQYLTAIVTAYLKGAMPFEALFDLYQRADLIDAEMTPEQALAAIQAEATARAATAAANSPQPGAAPNQANQAPPSTQS